MELVREILAADRRALAKSISIVENNSEEASRILKELIPHTGRALIIGVTGPPGAGKSTLIGHMIKHYISSLKKIGVLAIDPSSEFTGGAILGDRLRMIEASLDKSVFMRSMASRGRLGGLSRAVEGAVAVLDAAGMDVVIIETVGTGQGDVSIETIADIVVAVLMPQMGDEIQAIKAGLMEIADIYIVNKADLAGSERTVANLLTLAPAKFGSKPLVFKATANKGEGVAVIMTEIDRILQSAKEARTQSRRIQRAEAELMEAIQRIFSAQLRGKLKERPEWESAIKRILQKETTAEAVAEELIKKYFS